MFIFVCLLFVLVYVVKKKERKKKPNYIVIVSRIQLYSLWTDIVVSRKSLDDGRGQEAFYSTIKTTMITII